MREKAVGVLHAIEGDAREESAAEEEGKEENYGG